MWSSASRWLPEEIVARTSHLRRGWSWGSQAFSEKLLKLVASLMPAKKACAYRSTTVRRAHDKAQAEQWLTEGLEVLGLSLTDFQKLKGTDARKAALAELLCKRTVVSQEWLAKKLS